jgi:hypothetical protein
MAHTRYRLVITLIACLSAPTFVGATEPEAAGIVRKVTGEITPDLSAGVEIASNASITLGPGAELTFLHYPPNCELVTVAGGTLKLTRTAFTTDGDVRSQQTRTCPRMLALALPQTGMGGMVARDLLRLPVGPELIFSGPRADQVTGAAVYEKGQPNQLLFRFELVGHRATQPGDTAPLSPNRQYVLKLMVSGEPQPIDYSFIAVTPGPAGSLAVMHLD